MIPEGELIKEDIVQLLREISYRDARGHAWEFRLVQHEDDLFLQVVFHADDADQYGRLWHLWPGMGVSGVVKTAWAAVKMAEEHEAAERFRWRGTKVFNPHVGIEQLRRFIARSEALAATEDPS